MINLHRKFLLENTDCSISYSLFCHMQPFWVVQLSIGDRETCLCKVHENLSFLVDKLHSLRLIRGTDSEDLVDPICCDPNSKDCMYNTWLDCKNYNYMCERFSSKHFFYTVDNRNCSEREEQRGPKRQIAFENHSEKKTDNFAKPHWAPSSVSSQISKAIFQYKEPFHFLPSTKEEHEIHECISHVDFSENYACKYSSEIQAVHFASNHHRATLHTGVLHVGGVEEHVCFATISPLKEKGPAAIWTHLSPILDLVKDLYPKVTMVHFFSDGPCTQYRQKGNFYLFCTKLQERGFQSGTWSFFEASHGKGAPDMHCLARCLQHARQSPSSDIDHAHSPNQCPRANHLAWCELPLLSQTDPGV